MTKWIVVFKVASCYDTGFTWPGWIRAKQSCFSGECGCLFHQFCVSAACLVGLLLFPAPLISVLAQLPSITRTNSIRQEIVLKVFDAISFWCVDSSSVWENLVRVVVMSIFLDSDPFSTQGFQIDEFPFLLSLPSIRSLPFYFPFSLSSITQNGNDCVIKPKACLASQILENHLRAIACLSDAQWYSPHLGTRVRNWVCSCRNLLSFSKPCLKIYKKGLKKLWSRLKITQQKLPSLSLVY